MKFLSITLLILLSTLIPVFGQVKYSNEFLNIGLGARAQGMSNAVIASTNDVYAGYWNPAGLSQLEDPFSIGVMHSEWFAGIAKYDYIGFAKQLNADRQSAIGLSIIRLGIDNIPYTINLVGPDGSINYDNVTSFSAADYAGILSYAQKLGNKGWRIGGNAKIVRRVIGRFGRSWGFGLDAGIQYQSKHLRFAVVGRDISTTFNAWSFTLTEEEKEVFEQTNNTIPVSSVEITRPRIITGLGYFTNFGKSSLLAEMNLDFTTDGQRNVLVSSKAFNMDPHVGLEYGYNGLLYLRGGIGNFQQATENNIEAKKVWLFQPNFGIGLQLGRLHLDYALTDVGDVSQVLYSHIFSLAYSFKTKDTGQ
jgi:hypothetical protein